MRRRVDWFGHFCRFAADERAAGDPAAFGNAGHHAFGDAVLPQIPEAIGRAIMTAVADTRRAGSAGISPPEVFSDPAPSSVEER